MEQQARREQRERSDSKHEENRENGGTSVEIKGGDWGIEGTPKSQAVTPYCGSRKNWKYGVRMGRQVISNITIGTKIIENEKSDHENKERVDGEEWPNSAALQGLNPGQASVVTQSSFF